MSVFAIDGFSQMVNAGPEAVIDLLEAKMMQTTETTHGRDGPRCSSLLMALATVARTGWGLQLLSVMPLYGPATVGGIVVADNAWWRSQVDDVGAGALVSV